MGLFQGLDQGGYRHKTITEFSATLAGLRVKTKAIESYPHE